jgi:hypothetical protein
MATNDVVFLLQEFESKLSDLNSSDPEVNAELRAARHQIRDILSHPDSVPEPDEFLIKQLSSLTEHFEVEHPVLTEWVSRLSDMLSRIGI